MLLYDMILETTDQPYMLFTYSYKVHLYKKTHRTGSHLNSIDHHYYFLNFNLINSLYVLFTKGIFLYAIRKSFSFWTKSYYNYMYVLIFFLSLSIFFPCSMYECQSKSSFRQTVIDQANRQGTVLIFLNKKPFQCC